MNNLHDDEQDRLHYNRGERYVKNIENLYKSVINQISQLPFLEKVDKNKPFKISDYPTLKKSLDRLFLELAKNISFQISSNSQTEWRFAEKKMVDLAKKYSNNPKYRTENLEALNAFLNRKDKGLNLSDRVWNYTKQFKNEIELGLDLGIGEGKSAAQIARELKSYLKDPDKLFHRVRDKHGNLYLSKNAENYHPGQGVYRSSYKNAERLARTETNMAYHEAIFEKYQQFDFVIGIQVRLSNNPNHCPFCAAMAGKYPKDFKFTGWHPNCRCTTIPILKPLEETEVESKAVTELHKPFEEWIEKNKNKIQTTPQQPYFIQNNRRYVDKVLDKKLYSEIYDLMKKAKESAGELSDLLKYLNKNFGGYATPINLKSEVSIYRKATQELNREVFNIKDAVRATVILPKEKYENILYNLENLRIFGRIKVQNPEQFSGYSGILTNVKTKNGIFAEIQFNTEKMIYAKERPQDAIRIIGEKRWQEINKETGLEGGLGHKFYEEMRVLPENSKRYVELKKKSIEYYSNFR